MRALIVGGTLLMTLAGFLFNAGWFCPAIVGWVLIFILGSLQ